MLYQKHQKTFIQVTDSNGRQSRRVTHWIPTKIPGIIITGQWNGERARHIGQFPCLTHEASGQLIGGPYVSIEQAKAVAGVLYGICPDWTGEVLALRGWVRRLLANHPSLGLWWAKMRGAQVNFAGEELE